MTLEGYHIFREYDSRDRLSSERVLDKKNGIDRTVTVSYDFSGNITSTKDANGGVITYRYNSQGKVCEITD